MTRLWRDGFPIAAELDERERPARLLLSGRWLDVRNVEQHWQVDTDWWTETGRVWRDYFALTTRCGILCVIYRDFLTDKWWLERVYD